MVTRRFTKRSRRVYPRVMLWIAALAAASVSIPPAQPQRQARATVRILRAEPLLFQEMERNTPSLLRTATVRTREGKSQAVRLVEYQ